MRRTAPGLLALLAGCNWVFGLDETKARPDAPPLDASWTTVHLNLLQATLDTSSDPVAPTEAPMPDLAQVQVGTLDGGPLNTVSATSGTFTVPPEIVEPGWRLVYQRTGGVVRELQNLPSGSHVIEPLWGPLMRTAPGATSGYLLNPTGTGINHAVHRVYTIGTWTEGFQPLPTGNTIDYDYASATSYSGPLGAPAPSDRGVLVDFTQGAECRTAIGSMEFAAGTIGPPKMAQVGNWFTDSMLPSVNTPIDVLTTDEVRPFNETQLHATEQYGFIPSMQMPAFARPPQAQRQLHLPNPPIIALRTCQLPGGTNVVVHAPKVLGDNLPEAVHTEITSSRMVGAVELVNGLAILTPKSGNTFAVSTSVAFAGNIKLSSSAAMFSLSGASDGAPLVVPTGVMTLTWDKTQPGGEASFWEVTLSELSGSQLLRRRIYTTLVQSVTIQKSELETGKHYVLAISAYSGRGTAAMGDFRGITDTQEMSLINARTFVVQ
ncbi:MAG: hypothetical protein H0T46_10810 [Deltaproteobacteria bacterium]|nr:hypothetical protein [Deltaproteobacteria bacterium]